MEAEKKSWGDYCVNEIFHIEFHVIWVQNK